MRDIPRDVEEVKTHSGRVIRTVETGPTLDHPIGVDADWTEKWMEVEEYTDPAPDVSDLIIRIEAALVRTQRMIQQVVCAQCGQPGLVGIHYKDGTPCRPDPNWRTA